MKLHRSSQRTIQYLVVIMLALSMLIAPAAYAENIISTFAGTFAGDGEWGYGGDGDPAKSALFDNACDVAVDKSGNVYICDGNNSIIRKVDKEGIITTVAGIAPGLPHDCGDNLGDGGPATSACLEWPRSVAVDASGNLYITDTMHARIRKVDKDGIISTVAGTDMVWECENSGDGGPATETRLCWPHSVAVDSKGNLFIAGDNTVIRKVDKDGIITTVVGTHGVQGYSGDGGPATEALLGLTSTVAVDAHDNLYIADVGNAIIRKIGKDGIITTVAGTPGVWGYSGDGGPATEAVFDSPFEVAVDSAGNIYISDWYGPTVRKVDKAGIITTFAGTPGVEGHSGDGGAAAEAQLMLPDGLALEDNGKTLYIADPSASVIRKVRIGVKKRPVRCGCDICREYPSEQD